MTIKQKANLDGLELPNEFKQVCDYLNSLPDDIKENDDEEVQANVIADNPSGIDVYIKFTKAFRLALAEDMAKDLLNREVSTEFYEAQKKMKTFINADSSPSKETKHLQSHIAALKDSNSEKLETNSNVKTNLIAHSIEIEELSNEIDDAEKNIIELQEIITKAFEIDYISKTFTAIECIAAGIPQAVLPNMESMLKDVLNSDSHDRVLLRATEIVIKRENSRKANNKRQKKSHKIKAFAIKIYEEKKFPTVRNAAQLIAEQEMDYAHNSSELEGIDGKGKMFTNPFQAADTIERWLGAYKREQKNKLQIATV